MLNILGAGPASAVAGALLSLVGGGQATTPVAAPAIVAAQPTLAQLVQDTRVDTSSDQELNCLATAVYFEARGEPIEGQLAVADVVINRAASGRYPASWCKVVKQPWQFSFVQDGRFPRVDAASEAWRKAQAIAKIAADKMVSSVPGDVLWYHADYVAPRWRTSMSEVTKIGAHIFYRA